MPSDDQLEKSFRRAVAEAFAIALVAVIMAGFVAFAVRQFYEFRRSQEPLSEAVTIKTDSMRCLVWRGMIGCVQREAE